MKLNDTKADWMPNIDEETLGDGRVVFVASHPELLGILAQADSREAALKQWQINLMDFFEDVKQAGSALPPPNHLSFFMVVEASDEVSNEISAGIAPSPITPIPSDLAIA